MPFVVRSPDGFALTREDHRYATRAEAEAALATWAKGFVWQGFYKTGGGDYLPVEEIPRYSRILEVEEMDKITKVLQITNAQQYDDWCVLGPSDTREGEVIAEYNVDFDGGYIIVVQVVAGTCGEPCWTQAVLFDSDGCEIGSSDVGDSFTGEYTIEDSDENRRYTVLVISPEPKRHDEEWQLVVDSAVLCHWKCGECGETCDVPPDWYCENGTPSCSCGKDMKYKFTQIKKGVFHAL